MTIPCCEYCWNLVYGDYAQTNCRNVGVERRLTFCKHPKAEERCRQVSNRYPGFICFTKRGSTRELEIKTSPRWCPYRSNE